MLVKMTNELCRGSLPTIRKYINGEDAALCGAAAESDTVRFEICAPRVFGLTGAEIRICNADSGEEFSLPLEYSCTAGVFSAETSRLGAGLYRYTAVLHRGNDTLCSDTDDNVHFTLGKDAGRQFRLLIYADGFKTPEWFKGGVMYQIFTDRFAKSGKSPLRQDVCNESDWYAPISQFAEKPGDPLKNDLFYGGDLYGISEKLAYLKELGVTVLYLNPVFKAASNHKYDTGDYNTADPAFGGDEALSALFAEAKKYGIRVILDGVFNHTGDDSLYFNKYGNYPSVGAYKHPESPYRDWYTFGRDDDDYECWWGIKIHPRLRQANPDCRSFFCGRDGVGAKYVKEGSGGWRLDVADELPDVFLEDLRKSVKDADPDALIIGEVWENAADKIAYGKLRKYFQGHQLDSVMNYPLRTALVNFILHKDGRSLARCLTDIYSSYPKFVCDCLMNIIGTHDTERILTVLGDKEYTSLSNRELSLRTMSEEEREIGVQRLKIASCIQYTVYGVPSVYYGDEAGVEGGRDPFCRRTYPWGRENGELLQWYKRLGALRRDPVYRDGAFCVTDSGDGYIVYERTKGAARIVSAANVSDTVLHTGICGTELLGGAATDGDVAPMSVSVIRVS